MNNEEEITVLEDDSDTEIITIENDNTEEIVIMSEEVPTSDKHFTYNKATASDTWNITHNLNKFPSVTVVDSALNEVIGDVKYIDTNNLVIYFKGAFSGKAYLN